MGRILFLDSDVIIFDDVNPGGSIVTSINPCAPTPLRPNDVTFLFIDNAPTHSRPDDVIIFDDVTYVPGGDKTIAYDVTYLIYSTKIN